MLAALVVIFLVVEYARPRPIDWQRTYNKSHTKPFGDEGVYRLLREVFPTGPLMPSRVSPYEWLELGKNDQLLQARNYILVAKSFPGSKEDIQALLNFAEAGNHVFLASAYFGSDVNDMFGIQVERIFPEIKDVNLDPNEIGMELKKGFTSRFVNRHLNSGHSYDFPAEVEHFVFSGFNRDLCTVLAVDENNQPVFLRCKTGRGYLYLHCIPDIFTNYGVLKEADNHEYLASAFSYLPDEPTVWDDFYASGREGRRSEIRFLLNHPSLRWAWLTFFIGIPIYMYFFGKRRQKIIPVVRPPVNSTMEFVSTVGRLYFNQGDHSNLARKQVVYFLDSIRDRMHMTVYDTTADNFVRSLSMRSGVDEELTRRLVDKINQVRKGGPVNEHQLLELNRLIEQFNANSKR